MYAATRKVGHDKAMAVGVSTSKVSWRSSKRSNLAIRVKNTCLEKDHGFQTQ